MQTFATLTVRFVKTWRKIRCYLCVLVKNLVHHGTKSGFRFHSNNHTKCLQFEHMAHAGLEYDDSVGCNLFYCLNQRVRFSFSENLEEMEDCEKEKAIFLNKRTRGGRRILLQFPCLRQKLEVPVFVRIYNANFIYSTDSTIPGRTIERFFYLNAFFGWLWWPTWLIWVSLDRYRQYEPCRTMWRCSYSSEEQFFGKFKDFLCMLV